MATYTTNLNLKKPAASDAADIADINGNMDLIDAAVSAILGNVYPVGSIYMSVASTNPATVFGGTWEQIEDTFLLAAGTNYTAGDVGGEAQHTLTTAEMPNHYHTGVFWASTSSEREVVNDSGSGKRLLQSTNNAGGGGSHYYTGSVGSGNAHNNMPPYLAVYVWKRTA